MFNNDFIVWNWGVKIGMFYFGFCFFWVIWIFFYLFEIKECIFVEIDYFFKKKMLVCKFCDVFVDCKFDFINLMIIFDVNLYI